MRRIPPQHHPEPRVRVFAGLAFGNGSSIGRALTLTLSQSERELDPGPANIRPNHL